MNTRNKGIDLFRLIAAMMVVAIHTFPFQSVAPQLDEIVTLTFFRVAVPFFFMTTGYFVLGPYSKNTSYLQEKKIQNYLVNLVKIYGLVILLYLPLSIINGTIAGNTSLLTWLKLIIFDGTFYHLWYFPGIIIGTIIVVSLLKKTTFKLTFIVSSILYLIGLSGDSWYGFISQVSVIKHAYAGLFNVMTYTRSGLFFTPLFLCLGILIYRQPTWVKKPLKNNRFIGILVLLAMSVESLLLHQFSVVRHDSMYLFLPFFMLFLFILILNWQPKFIWHSTDKLSLIVYIVHPIVIVVVHTASNYITLLKNSVLNFLFVLVGSFLLAEIIIRLPKKTSIKKENTAVHRARKVISTKNIQNNLQEIRKILPNQTKVMGIIKADAYGCDMITYAKELLKQEVTFFGVATIDEAISLRKALIPGDILILGYTDPHRFKEIRQYDLIQSIVSEEYAEKLNRCKQPLRCHLQIDTGMHRLGVVPNIRSIQKIYRLENLRVEGIYSHLGSSDSLEKTAIERTHQQIETFNRVLTGLAEAKINYGVTHLQSSYGVLNYPDLEYDYVRLGVILYGFLSERDIPVKTPLNLLPVIKITSQLISKRYVARGECVGYGTNIQLTQETLIGVVSIGYADGVPRSLSNTGFYVSYAGKELRQIGNICMDMMLVDLSNAEDIVVGEEIMVMTDFERIATSQNTITNELLSRLGARLSMTLK